MRWHFTPGRVFMISLWSFLLGSSVALLATRLEGNVTSSWVASAVGAVAAAGGIILWLSFSRHPPSPGDRE